MSEPWLSADDDAVRNGVTKDAIDTRIAYKGMPARNIDKFRASEDSDWVIGGGAAGKLPDGEEDLQLAHHQ